MGSVQKNTGLLLEGGKHISREMHNLADVTREITDSMNEIAAGSGQITDSVEHCHNVSSENQLNLSDLRKEVKLFKIH